MQPHYMRQFRRVMAMVTATAAPLLNSPAFAAGTLPAAYVSTRGSDANTCTDKAPCRTLQHALNNAVAPKGTITLLDAGNYGPATISASVRIYAKTAAPAGVIGLNAGQTGLSIAAGATDQVTLEGLTVDGAGSGNIGVEIRSAKSVLIKNCTLGNFEIADQHTSGVYLLNPPGSLTFALEDTTITDATVGVEAISAYGQNVVVSLKRMRVLATNQAVSFYGAIKASVDDSSLSGNVFGGLETANSEVMVRNSRFAANAGGIANASQALFIDNVFAAANGDSGVQTSPFPRTTYTAGTNLIRGNPADISGNPLFPGPLK